MTSIRDLIKSVGVDRVINRALLRQVTGFNDAQLISHDDYQLNDAQYQQYCAAFERLQAGEPLAYILGYKEFYSRKFKVTPDTLIPRPETELVVEQIIKSASQGVSILDMGTGSGCIAISCRLERPDLDVTAVDVSSAALTVAKHNSERFGSVVRFIESDWYGNVSGRFAIIASNPPYIEANDQHLVNLQYEPQQALTDFADGLECIRILAKGAHRHLLDNGMLILEHGYNQALDVRKILLDSGFYNVVTLRDYAGIERISYGFLLNKE